MVRVVGRSCCAARRARGGARRTGRCAWRRWRRDGSGRAMTMRSAARRFADDAGADVALVVPPLDRRGVGRDVDEIVERRLDPGDPDLRAAFINVPQLLDFDLFGGGVGVASVETDVNRQDARGQAPRRRQCASQARGRGLDFRQQRADAQFPSPPRARAAGIGAFGRQFCEAGPSRTLPARHFTPEWRGDGNVLPAPIRARGVAFADRSRRLARPSLSLPSRRVVVSGEPKVREAVAPCGVARRRRFR